MHGYSVYRHDRVSRCGGGGLVFVNDELKLNARTTWSIWI